MGRRSQPAATARGRGAARSPALALALAVALAGQVAAAAGAGAEAGTSAGGSVHVERSDRNAEQVKKIPITRKRGAKPRAVISLPPDKVGRLASGDRIEAGGEGQISVCLKPNANHTSKRDDCVGRLYGFDPRFDAYLALAEGRKAAAPRQLTRLTPTVSRKCTQSQPHRNHHGVLTVPFSGLDIAEPSKLRCPPDRCRVKLAISASHKRAKRNNFVIVGGMSNGKIEHENRGSIALARYRPGNLQRPQPLVDRSPAQQRIKLSGDGADVKARPVYSVPVQGLRAGELLVVEGRYAASIKHLKHSARTRTQLVFGSTPRTSKVAGRSPAAILADTSWELDAQNNFNCTTGSSGHKTPCLIDKVGVLRIGKRSTDKTFYVNLIVAGHGALLNSSQSFRKGSVAKPTKAGYLKVWRYRP